MITHEQTIDERAKEAALDARLGTRETFLASLVARLSSPDLPGLSALRSRDPADPALAILDAWATAADVLAFYTERIAAEGYLTTATQRRSLVELARHVAYAPSPGVAASVMLSFSVEGTADVLIPRGVPARSLPVGDKSSQTFETSLDLRARAEWNDISLRRTVPQAIALERTTSLESLYIAGTGHSIKRGDKILVSRAKEIDPLVFTVGEVTVDRETQTTQLQLAENPFSIPSLRREVLRAIGSFIESAKAIKSLPAFTAVTATVEELVAGTQHWLPIIQLSPQSAIDKRLTEWQGAQALTDAGAAQALTELAAARPLGALEGAVRAALTADVATLTKTVAAVVAEFRSLSHIVGQVQPIADALDPKNAESVTRARDAITNLQLTIPGLYLADDAGTVAAFRDGVTALAADAGSEELQKKVDANRTAMFRRWPRGSVGDVSVQTGAELEDTARDLAEALAPVPERAAGERVAELLAAIKLVGKLAPRAGIHDELKKRCEALLALLNEAANTFGQQIDAVTLPAAAAGSKIVDDLRGQLDSDIKPMQAAAGLENKYPAVVTAISDIAQHVGQARTAAAAIVELVPALSEAVARRRRAFAAEIVGIRQSFTDLNDAAIPAHLEAWNELSRLRDALVEGEGQPSAAMSVGEILKRIEGEAGLITTLLAIDTSALPSGKNRIPALVRALRGVAACDGQTPQQTQPDNSTSTAVGGIGGVIEPPADTDDIAVIRSAGEVLLVPPNVASDVVAQLAGSFALTSISELQARWRAIAVTPAESRVRLLSAPYSLFGHNAPQQVFNADLTLKQNAADWNIQPIDQRSLFLAGEVPALQAPGYALLKRGAEAGRLLGIAAARVIARSDYGLSAKTTQLELRAGEKLFDDATQINVLRTCTVQVEASDVPLAERPIGTPVGPLSGDEAWPPLPPDYAPEMQELELDSVYLGLEPGRWLAIAGERVDLVGVRATELNRIKLVQHVLRSVGGDTAHTRLVLAEPLRHSYRRETVRISANLVAATHGETTHQILGSGDAGEIFQHFALAKKPLTYVADASAVGVASTLRVRVNNLLWHERPSLLNCGAAAREYAVRQDEQQHSIVQFGDGSHGARLPSGIENVEAEYRVGLGVGGNVAAGSITQLAKRPLGVEEVTNPLAATGGADADTIERIRDRAPLAMHALGRLVSLDDYASFALGFAGIEKAAATRLDRGGRAGVLVTVAGVGDMPLDENTAIVRNLQAALVRLSSSPVDVRVVPRELLLLFVGAKVRLEADHAWSTVEPALRAALYDRFGFAHRRLGQNAYLSQLQTVIQNVAGVAYVDVDIFGAVREREFYDFLAGSSGSSAAALTRGTSETMETSPLARLAQRIGSPSTVIVVEGARFEAGRARPAQIAYLSPAVPDALFLEEIKS